MKFLLRVAASVLAVSVFAACSGGTGVLPTKVEQGSSHIRPMIWNGCGVGETGAGCNSTSNTPDDGQFYVPSGCATATGMTASGPITSTKCTSGYWENVCMAMGLPGDCQAGTGSDLVGCQSDPASCVATVPHPIPAKETCDGSPTNHETGVDNLPANSNTWATTIVQIYSLQNGDGSIIYGWAYQTANQSMWWQTNSANPKAVLDLFSFYLDKLPLVSSISNALINATTQPYQLTGQQWQNIQQGYANSGVKPHKCYAFPYRG